MMTATTRQLRSADETAAGRLGTPTLRDGLVSRAALVNRVRTEQAPVVLLTAPAGYGKTTLLAQWSRRDLRAFAWVRLGPGDDGPEALLGLIVDAIDELTPVDDDVTRAVDGRPLRPSTVIRRLGRFLLANHEPLVVVLDGIEELESPESLDALTTLCEHLPPETQLVLSGRRAPRAQLARLRAEGRLAEITATDLRLSDREAIALLQNGGVELDTAAAEELNHRAEGWATGVYLSALALKTRSGKASRAASGFDGAHHFVAEYFESEVLGRLEQDDVEFLTHLSPLERMAGPLCDAVLGASGSGARLHELANAGAFLVPLDRERTWFRFHPFLRDMLRTRLREHEPARFAEVSRRAAAWYEEAGDLPTAIAYLRPIRDRAELARLLGATAPAIFGAGLLTPIEPCLDDLRAPQLLAEHPSAAVAGALAHAFLGHAAEAERWAATLDEGRPDGPLPDGTGSSEAWATLLQAALCRDGIDRMRECATAGADGVARHSPMFACTKLLLGVSQLLGGDADAAAATFTEAAELGVSSEAPLVASLAFAELSLAAQDADDWSAGEELARKARDLADGLDPAGHVAASLAYVASARSALRNSNWVRAEDDIERAHRLLPRLTEALPWLSAQVRLELARAHLALNDIGTAAELSAELDRLVLARPHLGTVRAAAFALRQRIEGIHREPTATGLSLTAAELRLLPLLTTHLTFRQIAEHLYVSRNTIKTQAISVYRKLGVSSRTEAIERAIEIGLLRPEGDTLERIG